MENVSNKKKTIFLIVVGILLVGSILMGVSYAAWVATLSQTGRNVVNTDCFGITFTDKDEIDLQNAFPIRESDAANLKPYEFTIANRCDTSEDYIINLETVAPTNISSEFVRIKIDDEQSTKLSQKTVNDNKVISNAIDARTIIVGNLVGKESKTYRLKMWIDESATVSDVENKSLAAKVTIAGTLNKNSKIITLNLNGGTLDINRILGTIGNKIGTLPTPIKDNYDFGGWFSDEELQNEVTTETVVTNDLNNLFAKWNESLAYDLNGYNYWYSTSEYSSTAAPETVYKDYHSVISPVITETLLRTTFVNGNPTKHAACMYYEATDKVFCLEHGYWSANGNSGDAVVTALINDMNSALNTSITSSDCYTDNNMTARCSVGSVNCYSDSDNSVKCEKGSTWCYVSAGGYAYCYN